MKANEFVKKHGWNSLLIAKTLLKFNRYKYVIFYADEIDFSNEFHAGRKSYMFEVVEVKRLVESYELVEKCGGLSIAKDFCRDFECIHIGLDLIECRRLIKAIADVESCQ